MLIDKIKDEYRLICKDGGFPYRIKITHDAYQTLLRDADGALGLGMTVGSPDSIIGMSIERVENGSLDAPCFQILVKQ